MIVRTLEEEQAAQLQTRLRLAVQAIFDEDSNAPADLALVQGLVDVIGAAPGRRHLPHELERFLSLRDTPERDQHEAWRLRLLLGTRLLNEIGRLPLNWLYSVGNRADEYDQWIQRPHTWSNPRTRRSPRHNAEHATSLREMQGPQRLTVQPGDVFLVWDNGLDREVDRARDIDAARTKMLKYLKAPGHHETTIVLVRGDEAIPIERWSV